MLQMCGAFAEFERSMLQARIQAGLKRAVANDAKLGRPLNDPKAVAWARVELRNGTGINRVAKIVGLSDGKVAKLKAEIEGLRESNRWLDRQVTTLREQRDQLAQDALSG
jgi:DNA invertase Pin-like site-specific DNA recombinase